MPNIPLLPIFSWLGPMQSLLVTSELADFVAGCNYSCFGSIVRVVFGVSHIGVAFRLDWVSSAALVAVLALDIAAVAVVAADIVGIVAEVAGTAADTGPAVGSVAGTLFFT